MRERLIGYTGTQAGSRADPSPWEGKRQIYDVCGRLGPVVGISSCTLWGWRLSPHPSFEAQDHTFIFRQCKTFFSPDVFVSSEGTGLLQEASWKQWPRKMDTKPGLSVCAEVLFVSLSSPGASVWVWMVRSQERLHTPFQCRRHICLAHKLYIPWKFCI